jgi:gas vesicle protein
MDSSVLGCFLVGVAVGVGIGMVAAPQTGRQTRRSVKTKADEATGYLRQRRVALRDSAADLIGKGRKAERRLDEESVQRMEGEGGREGALL